MIPDFPAGRDPAPDLSASLRAAGVTLRRAVAGDMDFLRSLYAGFRAEEMVHVPWPSEQKRAFLESQFRLQHLHFTRFHGAADFWIVMQTRPGGAPVPAGRLYLDRSGPTWRIVDIGLTAGARGRGIGTALIVWIQQAAAAAGAGGVALHVAVNNPRARALYLRQGFAEDGPAAGFHQPMAWRAGAARPARDGQEFGARARDRGGMR